MMCAGVWTEGQEEAAFLWHTAMRYWGVFFFPQKDQFPKINPEAGIPIFFPRKVRFNWLCCPFLGKKKNTEYAQLPHQINQPRAQLVCYLCGWTSSYPIMCSFRGWPLLHTPMGLHPWPPSCWVSWTFKTHWVPWLIYPMIWALQGRAMTDRGESITAYWLLTAAVQLSSLAVQDFSQNLSWVFIWGRRWAEICWRETVQVTHKQPSSNGLVAVTKTSFYNAKPDKVKIKATLLKLKS